jgi:virulence factor Mce-like protein
MSRATNIKGKLARISPRRLSVRSRRLTVLAVIVAAASIVVISSVGAGEKDGYLVRAQFVNSAGITKGADVRVAGANVGIIKQIFVTRSNDLASVVVDIKDPAFQTFYSDATCKIRLQSLIGEKFVDCDPGTPTKPELPQDPLDPDRRLMTVRHTSSPVDIDELLDAMREPQRERFRVIINELGVTLTGRGQDLQDILDRFDPTFKNINDVLKILADENRNLVRLAEDGDTALASLAANREHITGLFKNADAAARATNAKRQELAETLQLLPGFLDELEPTARTLKQFADQAAPVAASARASSSDLSEFVSGTDEFVKAANPALKRFGDTADVFRLQIPKIQPVADTLNQIGKQKGAVTNLKKLLQSFEGQDGYQNLAALTIGLVGSLNGINAYGHFARSALVVNGACLQYFQVRRAGCAADFSDNRDPSNQPPEGLGKNGQSANTAANKGYDKSGLSSNAAALDYLLGSEK